MWHRRCLWHHNNCEHFIVQNMAGRHEQKQQKHMLRRWTGVREQERNVVRHRIICFCGYTVSCDHFLHYKYSLLVSHNRSDGTLIPVSCWGFWWLFICCLDCGQYVRERNWVLINNCLLGIMSAIVLGLMLFRFSVAYGEPELGSYLGLQKLPVNLQKLQLNENRWAVTKRCLIQRQIC